MKKTLSILLCAGIALSQCNFVFADSAMEQALTSVKNKISVPQELTKFNTSTFDDNNGNVMYSFNWSDEDDEKNITVNADSAGHISNYSAYDSDWYKDDGVLKIDSSFDIADLEDFSFENLKKIAPELFSSGNDLLVPVPYDSALSLNSRSRYTFNYVRQHNGIEVKDNNASVSVIKTDSGFAVNDAYICWDYKTDFTEPENIIGDEAAAGILSEKFPMKLLYRKNYEDKYFLEYTQEGINYIDAQTSEELTEDRNDDIMPLAKQESMNAAADMTSNAGGSSRSLTPEERAELEKVNGLKTSAELLNALYSVPELGVSKPEDDKNINIHTYKSDDKYYTSVSITEEQKQEKQIYPRASINAVFDAKSGELKNFYRYSSDPKSTEDNKDDKDSQDKAYAFLTKYYNDKVSQTDKAASISGVLCTRKVNDIAYTGNYINASWNSVNNYIDSFSCEWDDDISKLPSPDGIISLSDATQKMFGKYPVKSLFIKTEGKYTQCYTLSAYDVRINAFNGKIVDYSGEEITDRHSGKYSDINDHWIKDIAAKLADYGIFIEGNELHPDEEITQAEFLKLVYSGICGYYWTNDNEQLYRRLINQKVLSDEEINSDAPLTRENSIRYLLRAMGIKEVAEIQGIYICDFADSDSISADKIGYCAIAKGFGIVNGSDGYLYPQNNITRAEALAMIYNYLTR